MPSLLARFEYNFANVVWYSLVNQGRPTHPCENFELIELHDNVEGLKQGLVHFGEPEISYWHRKSFSGHGNTSVSNYPCELIIS